MKPPATSSATPVVRKLDLDSLKNDEKPSEPQKKSAVEEKPTVVTEKLPSEKKVNNTPPAVKKTVQAASPSKQEPKRSSSPAIKTPKGASKRKRPKVNPKSIQARKSTNLNRIRDFVALATRLSIFG